MKIDLSADLEKLKRTFIQRNSCHEYLRVNDNERITQIENLGNHWKVLDDKKSKYLILLQVDSNPYGYKYTGIIKIVEKTRATVKEWIERHVEAKEPGDWMYYKRKRES